MPRFKCNKCREIVEDEKRPIKCELCEGWNTYEVLLETATENGIQFEALPVPLDEVPIIEHPRFKTNIEPVDVVTGGGLVIGAIYLLAGEPGIGKSTILAQVSGAAKVKTLYVSGEETLEQIKMRTDRIGISGKHIVMLNETCLEKIFVHALKLKIKLLIIDSVQVMRTETCPSAVNTVAQIRDCGNVLLAFAKTKKITTLIVGHVTKDGSIAGPKTIEHMVDCCMYFEQLEDNRKIRSLECPSKNRFGATNIRGLFEMGPTGLIPWKSESKNQVRSLP